MGARLTKNDWIEFGLKELAENGYEELRAQPLAKKLGVSRGSFYWHFEDIADYEFSVLALWESLATENIISTIDQSLDPKDRLHKLIEMALQPTKLERAVRSWSVVNASVAKVVSKIDQRRFKYIESILKDIGVEKTEIKYRALILYWAGIGRAVIENKNLRNMSSQNVKSLVSLMSS